jgi:hypothetical protein
MKRLYITFSGERYYETTKKIVECAPNLGADKVLVYDEPWLMKTDFYHQNQWIWRHHGDRNNVKRGFGWFCWKPFIIMDALDRVIDGDIVLFTDADTFPISDFSMLYDICARDGGIMLFAAQGCLHQEWCKRDCFIVMGQDDPQYRFQYAGVARFMLFQKGPWKAKQFLIEWLTYCLNPLAQTFDESVIAPEYPEMKEHRTEQAIMTNLAYKRGIHLYREACGFGNDALKAGVDKHLYPQLFKQVGIDWPHEPPFPLTGSVFANVA